MTNAKTVKLEFKKTTASLAGNQYGRNIYNKQIKDHFDPKGKIVIEFPDYIKDVAISFVQGLFKEMVDTVGVNDIFLHVEVKTNEEYLKKKIHDSIY